MILPEIVLLTTRAYERVNAELIARESERARQQDRAGSSLQMGSGPLTRGIRRAVRRAIRRARASFSPGDRQAGAR